MCSLPTVYNGYSFPTSYSAFLVNCFLYDSHGKCGEMKSQNSVFLLFWEIILLHHFHLLLLSFKSFYIGLLALFKTYSFLLIIAWHICICKNIYVPTYNRLSLYNALICMFSILTIWHWINNFVLLPGEDYSSYF